jgi:transcriptional regulator with XRE-family HTH domain
MMTEDLAEVAAQLGRRMAAKRSELGLRQIDLARQVPCGVGTISKLESGRASLGTSVAILIRIAWALGVNVSFLVNETTFDEPFLAEQRGSHFLRR